MKKVLLVLSVALLSLNVNAQSNSPLEDGFYSLKGYKSLGIDTSMLSGEMYITEGAIVFTGDCVSTNKYSVYFIGEFKGTDYELLDGGYLDIEGLGYWGSDNSIQDDGVYVTFNEEASVVSLSTPKGVEIFFVTK